MKLQSNLKVLLILVCVGGGSMQVYAADTALHDAINAKFADPNSEVTEERLLFELQDLRRRGASRTALKNGFTPLDVYINARLVGFDDYPSVQEKVISELPLDPIYELLFTDADVKALKAIENGHKQGNERFAIWKERIAAWHPDQIFDQNSVLGILPKKIQKLLKGLDFAKEEANAKAKKKGFWRNVKSKMRGDR